MNHIFRRVLGTALALSLLLVSVKLLVIRSRISDWHDFEVFYSAAAAALAGKSIYIVVGQYHLPFWYLPWTAWFFIPFVVWPQHIGLLLYQAASLISVVLVIRYLTRYYNPKFGFFDQLLIIAFLVPMSLQLVEIGQMDYILLGLLVLTIWAADHQKPVLGGLIFPFLLAKPHLIIPFTFYFFWRIGKRGLLVAGASSVVMLAIATIVRPGWYIEMLHLLQSSGLRTDGLPFTTFPSLLGGTENWIGTGNLPFTTILILVALLLVWKFRSLPTVPLLSLALTLSLFCGLRSYAYDLPLLIPGLVWLTAARFRTHSSGSGL